MTAITEIEKDALVVFIDFHKGAIRDNGMLPGWPEYYKETMACTASLAEYCQDNGIAMLNREYRLGDTARELARFNWDYYLGTSTEGRYQYGVSDYSWFSKVYFCGLSLDQCVMRREEGYIWTPHREKVVVRNCTLQGLRRLMPMEYVKIWCDSGFAPTDEQVGAQRFYERDLKNFKHRFATLIGDFKETEAFANMDALFEHVRSFLAKNEIPWVDWRPGEVSRRDEEMKARDGTWKDDRTAPLIEKARRYERKET